MDVRVSAKYETVMSIICLENIEKVFAAAEVQTHALRGVSMRIQRGEYVCIEGPSGCGKSTLLSIMGLLEPPTKGRYCLAGQAVDQLNFAEQAQIRNREIGFIFQSFNLVGDLTVSENVELPLTFRGMVSEERSRLVEAALKKAGIADRARHYPCQLSGGQQQRAAVARALAGHPTILLADEPTGNLDSNNGEAIMDLFDELHREGATICLVTHNPVFARHAQRTVHLFDGRLIGWD